MTFLHAFSCTWRWPHVFARVLIVTSDCLRLLHLVRVTTLVLALQQLKQLYYPWSISVSNTPQKQPNSK